MEITSKHKTSKNFHDSIHGTISLHEVLVAIIDTPEYQRLRDVKQLGTAYWIFPGGCHNRFEHGIGTSYLCGKMIEALRDEHKNDTGKTIEITETEILCIKIAGLIHDLGHGPFSHFFESFLRKSFPQYNWCHEEMSCKMFDSMLENNAHVKSMFQKYNITNQCCEFIKKLITGVNPSKEDDIIETTVYGDEVLKKSFLYEIVSNKRTSTDCDKFDYLARDAHHVGVTNTFNFLRFFQNIRIMPVDGRLEICVRDKEVYNLYELFHLRWHLHRQVYQHKTVNITDELLYQALKHANRILDIESTINNPSNFMYFTDSIFYEILKHKSTDEEIKKSKAYLHCLQTRDFFKLCSEIVIPKELVSTLKSKANENLLAKEIAMHDENVSEEDIFIGFAYMNLGMRGNRNPIENVSFFKKNGETTRLKSDEVSRMLPTVYEEHYLRIYAKHKDKKDYIERAFSKWCQIMTFNSEA